MAKSSNQYVCENCGREYAAWQGKCDECGEWSTIVEQKISENVTEAIRSVHGKFAGKKLEPVIISAVSAHKQPRISTNISELDRVLGDGLMPGSVILLTGEPGVGKSTLLMQMAGELAGQGRNTLYISAEESLEQVADRAVRVLAGKKYEDRLQLVNAFNLESIVTLLVETKSSDIIILDSIQTISSSEVRGIPGGMSQVKYCASELSSLAKSLGKTLVIVGHINKEGSIAGPKILEHLVDVVLHFSGDDKTSLRMLRPQKNRFHSVDEVGIFLMEEQGLQSIDNPGEYFLGEHGADKDVRGAAGKRETSQVGACRSMIMEGIRPLVVEVQALAVATNYPYPKRVAEGISLARLQLITAVLARYAKLKLVDLDIYVNVAQGLKVQDRSIDLAVAAAIVSSVTNKPIGFDTVVFGELNLSGRVGKSANNSRRLKESKRLGYKNIINAESITRIQQLAELL